MTQKFSYRFIEGIFGKKEKKKHETVEQALQDFTNGVGRVALITDEAAVKARRDAIAQAESRAIWRQPISVSDETRLRNDSVIRVSTVRVTR